MINRVKNLIYNILLNFSIERWNIAETIIKSKPGKTATEVKSYRPIFLLLPITSKLFEKILLKSLKAITEVKNLLTNHQFGFRQKHSTIELVHRLIKIIEKALLEGEEVCSNNFS